MKRVRQGVSGLLLFLSCSLLQAELLVEVHGYLGSAASWERSGVNAALSARGWQRGGVLLADRYGARLLPIAHQTGAQNRIFTVELPSQAPMLLQADMLEAMLGLLTQQYPDQRIILLGHSAGGVVARLALVRAGGSNVKALITIATPHLGTVRALQALQATDTPFPFCLVENFFSGGQYSRVKQSRGALLDLMPAQPGSLLHWLNQQPHPAISYHSVIRTGPVGVGDQLVPLFSQDMNNTEVLKGQSGVTRVAFDHQLNPQDGWLLAKLLTQL